MKLYNVACGRCAGSGKYDRGACFSCKGFGSTTQKRKPKGDAVKIKVSYENGSENNFSIYCNEKLALELVERLMRIKGYVGKVEIIK